MKKFRRLSSLSHILWNIANSFSFGAGWYDHILRLSDFFPLCAASFYIRHYLFLFRIFIAGSQDRNPPTSQTQDGVVIVSLLSGTGKAWSWYRIISYPCPSSPYRLLRLRLKEKLEPQAKGIDHAFLGESRFFTKGVVDRGWGKLCNTATRAARGSVYSPPAHGPLIAISQRTVRKGTRPPSSNPRSTV